MRTKMSNTENSPPNSDDEDKLPRMVTNDANNYIDEESKERELYRRFKITLFIVGIIISIVFFIVGLNKASYLFYSNIKLAEKSIILQQKQLDLDERKLKLLENKTLKPTDIESLKLSVDREEKITSGKTISNGMLLALVSIFFGIALTILLNLSKNSFKAQNEDNNEIATPLGNLILEMFAAIKEKLSSK